MRINFLPKISENFEKSGSKKKRSVLDLLSHFIFYLRNASNVKIYAVATQETIVIWLNSDPI